MTSEAACRLACEIESEFLCRSFLYMGAPHSAAYNCRLYHLDHHTLPDGPSAYLNAERPLIDDGEPIGKYFENFCESKCCFVTNTYENILSHFYTSFKFTITYYLRIFLELETVNKL